MPIDNKSVPSNRADNVRRDKDQQKSLSISLYDIDQTILNHLKNNLKLQVEQAGVTKTVTCMFGSPELWDAMQKNSFIRDYQGKISIPAIVIKRTSSASDDTFFHFNRYLTETAIKIYSEKNQYTKFSVLNGRNAPTNELYNITFPSHLKLTYHLVIWTEYVEQMNKLVETFQFNTKDYWGTKEGYRFRVNAPSFGHVVELQSGDDRLVKTEFDLVVNGYILPETITKLNSRKSTFNKTFTPKKIIIGVEITDDTNLVSNIKYQNRWANQQYPNKNKDDIIPTAPISMVDGVIDDNTLMSINILELGGKQRPFYNITTLPQNENSNGRAGDISFDDNYLYVYTNKWKRVALSLANMCRPGKFGDIFIDSQYFNIYYNSQWKHVAISDNIINNSNNYLYIYDDITHKSVLVSTIV